LRRKSQDDRYVFVLCCRALILFVLFCHSTFLRLCNFWQSTSYPPSICTAHKKKTCGHKLVLKFVFLGRFCYPEFPFYFGCFGVLTDNQQVHVQTHMHTNNSNTCKHTHTYTHTHRLSASTCVWWRDSLDLWYSRLLFTSRTSLSFSHTHESRRHDTHFKQSCHAHKGVMAHT